MTVKNRPSGVLQHFVGALVRTEMEVTCDLQWFIHLGATQFVAKLPGSPALLDPGLARITLTRSGIVSLMWISPRVASPACLDYTFTSLISWK